MSYIYRMMIEAWSRESELPFAQGEDLSEPT